ncbi:MAG: L-rhamnose mutarotase [Maribacter sp.]|nr:L-rhamnose mutarotase [Maribacter sp.]
MQLNEGQKKEYIKRHKENWPELKLLLKEPGVCEYSNFLIRKLISYSPLKK